MGNNLTLKDSLDLNTNSNPYIPTGSIIFVASSTYDVSSPTDTGLCPCDGRALSRSTYANLFSVIGTTYGVGDNSTTFNVPNLYTETRLIAMKGNSDNLGSTSGSTSHTHTVNTNATGNTNSDGFDHVHYGAIGNNDGGGGHAHSVNAAYVGMNSAAAHVGAGAKRDGNNSLASINHNHAMYFNGTNAFNGAGGHNHGMSIYQGTSTGTGHSHSFTTSTTVGSATVLPPYAAGLAYIKI